MKKKLKEIIKIEYENGVSPQELAEKYNQKTNTINVWAKRHNWSKRKQKKRLSLLKQNDKKKSDKKDKVTNDSDKVTTLSKKKIIEEIIESEEKKIKNGAEKSKFKRLTEKEKEFIRNYFACKFNVRMATLKSGFVNYSYGLAILKKEKIKKIIDRIKRTFVELDPLRIDADYLLEELTKNHFKAAGVLKQKNAEVVEKKIRKPVVIDVDGKKVVKYGEITEAELFEYETAITDLRASNQALQLIAKLKGLDKPQEEKEEKHNAMIELLANITKAVDGDNE